MSKEELLEFTGEVIEKLPNAMFRVKLENGVEILAYDCLVTETTMEINERVKVCLDWLLPI